MVVVHDRLLVDLHLRLRADLPSTQPVLRTDEVGSGRRTTGTWDCGGPAARKPLPDENSKEGYCAPGLFLLRMCARALSEPRNEFEYTVRACVRRQGECVSVVCSSR